MVECLPLEIDEMGGGIDDDDYDELGDQVDRRSTSDDAFYLPSDYEKADRPTGIWNVLLLVLLQFDDFDSLDHDCWVVGVEEVFVDIDGCCF